MHPYSAKPLNTCLILTICARLTEESFSLSLSLLVPSLHCTQAEAVRDQVPFSPGAGDWCRLSQFGTEHMQPVSTEEFSGTKLCFMQIGRQDSDMKDEIFQRIKTWPNLG